MHRSDHALFDAYCRFRTGEYDIPNLTVLDEATTRVLEVGGVRLRLFGLGGALVMAKMFDNGEFGLLCLCQTECLPADLMSPFFQARVMVSSVQTD